MTDELSLMLEAIEADKPNGPFSISMRRHGVLIGAAYAGSMDAALVLHETLLPDTLWKFTPLGRCVVLDKEMNTLGDSLYRNAATPARAWLLAILRAKLAEAPTDIAQTA